MHGDEGVLYDVLGRGLVVQQQRGQPDQRSVVGGVERDKGLVGVACSGVHEPSPLAPHERTFGLWRVDGSPKPSVAAVAAFVGAERCAVGQADAWIDIDRCEFRLDPGRQVRRLYRRYRALAVGTPSGESTRM